MCNSIKIPDAILSKAKDGEEIEVMVKGVVEDDGEGGRFIAVSSVEGEDVEDFEDDMEDMDSDDALTLFIGKINKKKQK